MFTHSFHGSSVFSSVPLLCDEAQETVAILCGVSNLNL